MSAKQNLRHSLASMAIAIDMPETITVRPARSDKKACVVLHIDLDSNGSEMYRRADKKRFLKMAGI
jgi:hypothetical protein